jgi:hypothetical protein
MIRRWWEQLPGALSALRDAYAGAWSRFLEKLPEESRLRKWLIRLQQWVIAACRWTAQTSWETLRTAGLLKEEPAERRHFIRSAVHPDDLMADITKSTLSRTLMISLAVHVVVIGLTSIHFMGLCVKYHSLHPYDIIREEKIAAEEKARQEALAAKQQAGKAASEAGTPETGAPDESGTSEEKSPIEKELEAVSDERPTEAVVSFDDIEMLE